VRRRVLWLTRMLSTPRMRAATRESIPAVVRIWAMRPISALKVSAMSMRRRLRMDSQGPEAKTARAREGTMSLSEPMVTVGVILI